MCFITFVRNDRIKKQSKTFYYIVHLKSLNIIEQGGMVSVLFTLIILVSY